MTRRSPMMASLLAGIASLYLSSVAFACSCASPTPESLIRSSQFIFTGQVVEVERRRLPRNGYDHIYATIDVTDVWRGEVGQRVVVEGFESSAACGYAHFPIRETITLLASASSIPVAPAVMSVSACPMVAYFRQRAAMPGALANYRDRRRAVETAAQSEPGNPTAQLLRASFMEEWREAGAEAAYREIAERFPGEADAHLGLGRVLFAGNRLEDAKLPLAQTLALRPTDVDAARLLGQARIRTGDLSELQQFRDFRSIALRGTDLSHRNLIGADFSRADLSDVLIEGSDLRDARFDGAGGLRSLARSDLRGASLSMSAWGINMAEARLDGAAMPRAMFGSAVLVGTSLRGVSAVEANFNRIDGTGAVFARANLTLACFAHAKLTNTDFRNANLNRAIFDDADLSTANLGGATFRRARYNQGTRFPQSFDPVAHGMMRRDGPGHCSH